MSLLGQLAKRVAGAPTDAQVRRDFDARLDRYLTDRRPVEGDGEALLEAFLRSGGSSLTEASARVAAAAPSYDFSEAEDVLGLWAEPGSMERTLASLRRDGYALLDSGLPPSTVEELRAAFAQAPCTLTSDMGSSLADGETVTVDLRQPLAEKYAVTTDALLANATVRRLLLDRGLLQMAQAYLGSAPIVDIVTAWYSFPSAKPSHEAAQLFHFDLDRVRWVKAFFLLTDCTIETGAHLYIPGTQRDGGIDDRLLAKGYSRLEDDEVARYYPRETWKPMEAPAGTILLEDTRGLHKGISLKRDHRLMLQFEYAQTLFGHVPHLASVPLSPIDDASWTTTMARYPEVFAALRR